MSKPLVSAEGTSATATADQAQEADEQQLAALSAPLALRAPRMPKEISALLHENWAAFDPEGERLFEWLRKARAWSEFAHARTTFLEHLKGTYGMLAAWKQPPDVSRCGLLHSSYTTGAFHFRYFDIADPQSRGQLRDVVGSAAEHLIYQYCAYEIAGNWIDQHIMEAVQKEHNGDTNGFAFDPNGYDFPCRANGDRVEHVSIEDFAKLMVVWVADVADQFCQVNAWVDVYLPERPTAIWPGDGAPATFLHLFSKILREVRPYLEVVPPVFNGCTEVLSFQDEREARDLYWRAVQQQRGMPPREQEDLFRRAAELNPYIGEPRLMLSQLLFNRGAFPEAAREAATALELFYQWATAWDKRNSYAQWVGFSRMALLRAARRAQGLTALPQLPLAGKGTAEGASPRAIYLQDLIKEFDEAEEGEQAGAPRSRL